MNRRHFQILYRQCLFRIVDLEILSAHARGDATRLLGQFAALLILVSVSLAAPALFSSGRSDRLPEAAAFVATLIGQHFLIATTMLVVGVFGILSWDGTFPDRRDVFVLSPLPVHARTILLAKVSAAATALALTVVLLHSMLGLVWPFLFSIRAEPVTLPVLAFDPTPSPVGVRELKSLLDRALAEALTNGSLKQGTGAGMAIAVRKDGERRIWAYGEAKPDSIFEIGSVTKTFTGLMLARMVSEGKARLDEPVRQLLPPGLAATQPGNEITLADLATHHSGLPMMPDNFLPGDPANPYADYTVRKLYEYVQRRGLVRPEDTLYRYSNLGVGLLGQALAERAGRRFPSLLREQITEPLGLNDTAVELSSDQRSRFLQGHDSGHKPVHEWDLNALAGAGGLRSSAGDMLKYLEANLYPERYPTLASALAATQRVRAHARAGAQIGLAWTYHPETGAYRHGGTTAGFKSHAFFVPRLRCAAVVLMNSGSNLVFNPDLVAEHIRQRFSGEPAISLGTVVVPAHAGLARSYASYWFTMCAAALFVYGVILGIQGLLAQILPRGLFLRCSGYVQMLAFSLTLVFFFLQPGLGGLEDLTARQTWRVVQWMPSFWFLGLYQQLNGTMHPALAPLAQRAWIGLLVVLSGSAVAYALSYARTLRRIAEEPDIPLAPARWRRLPEFGSRFQTAVGRFTVRTFVRSKQHRLTLAFYLGIGLAFTSLLMQDPSTKRALADSAAGNPWKDASVALWASSIIMMTLAVVGTRVAFALPVDLPASWLFRVTGTRRATETLAAARLPLVLIAVVPVWVVSASVCLGLWPSWQSIAHLLALGLMGLIVVELCLLGFRKIPFACSYLPGKSRVHIVFMGAFGLLLGSIRVALLEREALKEYSAAAGWMMLLVCLWFVAHRLTRHLLRDSGETQFEERDSTAVQGLLSGE